MSNESNDQREMVYKFTGKYGVTKVEIEEDIQYFDTWRERRAYCVVPTMVKMKIPQNKLMELVKLDNVAEEEYNIRMNNPAVKDAYNKYQMLLALVR